MASQSLTGMRFDYQALPLLPGVQHYAKLGCIPGGALRNEDYLTLHTHISDQLDLEQRAIVWDPQTSGGLFAAIDPTIWPQLINLASDVAFWHIGTVTERVQREVQVLLEVF